MRGDTKRWGILPARSRVNPSSGGRGFMDTAGQLEFDRSSSGELAVAQEFFNTSEAGTLLASTVGDPCRESAELWTKLLRSLDTYSGSGSGGAGRAPPEPTIQSAEPMANSPSSEVAVGASVEI